MRRLKNSFARANQNSEFMDANHNKRASLQKRSSRRTKSDGSLKTYLAEQSPTWKKRVHFVDDKRNTDSMLEKLTISIDLALASKLVEEQKQLTPKRRDRLTSCLTKKDLNDDVFKTDPFGQETTCSTRHNENSDHVCTLRNGFVDAVRTCYNFLETIRLFGRDRHRATILSEQDEIRDGVLKRRSRTSSTPCSFVNSKATQSVNKLHQRHYQDSFSCTDKSKPNGDKTVQSSIQKTEIRNTCSKGVSTGEKKPTLSFLDYMDVSPRLPGYNWLDLPGILPLRNEVAVSTTSKKA